MAIEEHLAQIHELSKDSNRGTISQGYPTVESFILQRGHRFKSQPLTPEERQLVMELPWRSHRPRECFRNAQSALVTTRCWDTFRYVEGYLSPKTPFPVLHAWLTINGKVVDTTLRTNPDDDNERVYGIIPDGWEYYGVALPIQEIFHVYDKHKTHISLLDDFQCHWPIIRRLPADEMHRDTDA